MLYLAPNPPIDISDIIGFIIAFLAFIYMAIRPFIERKGKLRKKEGEEEREEPFLEDPFFEEEEENQEPLGLRENPKQERKLTKKWEKDRFNFQSTIERRQKPSAIEKRQLDSSISSRRLEELEASFKEEITEGEAYETKEIHIPSEIEGILRKNTLRNSILVSEILNEPRGFRGYDGRPHGL